MAVHRGSHEMNENMSLPGTPSACRHREPPKVLKNWPRLSEVPPNSTTIGLGCLMTALHQKQTTDFFHSAIALPDSPGTKGPKIGPA